MPSLRELQHRAYRAIARDRADDIVPFLAGATPAARARLRVYTNNLRETARRALAADFPVIARLVGEACFLGLARLYVRRFPSRSGDLARFGDRFACFLTDLYADSVHGYLGAVAELEWASVECESAADAPPIDANAVLAVAVTDLPRLRISLHPAVRLVASEKFAIVSIWRSHQDETIDCIDPRSAGERALVYRAGRRVLVRPIDRPTFALLAELRAHGALLKALDKAMSVDADFDAAAAMRELYAAGLFVGCEVTDSIR